MEFSELLWDSATSELAYILILKPMDLKISFPQPAYLIKIYSQLRLESKTRYLLKNFMRCHSRIVIFSLCLKFKNYKK